MIILLSAKYVEQDLRVEFGEIPPTFLPVGNQRLYKHQIRTIREIDTTSDIYLTLPKSFDLSEWDKGELSALDINIIWIDPQYSLGQSIAFCLSSVEFGSEECVTIYYGDTLLKNGIPTLKGDYIYTAKSDYNYLWFDINENNQYGSSNEIFCGVLSISKPNTFTKCLISESFNFENSIKRYNEQNRFNIVDRNDWLDFGHLNTFYDSKTIVTTERAFNSLNICKNFVEKKSKKKFKLNAEANWFANCPEAIMPYTPRIYSHVDLGDEYSYKIEYLFNPTLTELFVYGNHPKKIWDRIINSCFEFLDTCVSLEKEVASDVPFYDLLTQKNKSRLEEFLKDNNEFSSNIYDKNGNSFNLIKVLEECHNLIDQTSKTTFVHGDFCFSNTLYDFRKKQVKVIDPRGIDFDDHLSIYGDIRYDLAKLCHSAIGMYDYIVSDRFDASFDGHIIELVLPKESIDLSSTFRELIETRGYSFNEILALTVTLFLSMLPLHFDKPKRQIAFVATAINLFKEIKK